MSQLQSDGSSCLGVSSAKERQRKRKRQRRRERRMEVTNGKQERRKGRKDREGRNAILERPNAIDVDSVASHHRWRKRKEWKRPMPSVPAVRASHPGLPNMAGEIGRGRREIRNRLGLHD